MFQKYSCVTSALLSVPNIWAYDKIECMKRTMLVILFNLISYSIVLPYFTRATFKAINVKILSESTRRIQRKFLVQLFLQATVPLIFVMIPTLCFGLAILFNIFGVKCKDVYKN